MIFERPPISLALIMCGLGVASAATACTDRRDPLASPTAGVVLRFGNSLSSGVIVSSPGVHRDGTVTLPGVTPEVKDVPYGKFDQWGGRVIFIEPDGRGGQRICRVETWESRSIEPTSKGAQEPRIRLRTDSHGKVGVVAYKPTPAQERNPVLAPLLPYYFMSGARGYFYDNTTILWRWPRTGLRKWMHSTSIRSRWQRGGFATASTIATERWWRPRGQSMRLQPRCRTSLVMNWLVVTCHIESTSTIPTALCAHQLVITREVREIRAVCLHLVTEVVVARCGSCMAQKKRRQQRLLSTSVRRIR